MLFRTTRHPALTCGMEGRRLRDNVIGRRGEDRRRSVARLGLKENRGGLHATLRELSGFNEAEIGCCQDDWSGEFHRLGFGKTQYGGLKQGLVAQKGHTLFGIALAGKRPEARPGPAT